MRRITCEGFTLIELIISVTLIGAVFAIAMPSIILSRTDAKEEEVKVNIHAIQMALARYANDYEGQYPGMIWGGDPQGWSTQKGYGCRTMWEHEIYDGTNEADAHPPLDPLLVYGYLAEYPRNPFLNPGQGLKTAIKWTRGPECQPGDGDPRFGYNGEVMGNILTDPRYLWSRPNRPTRLKNCFTHDAEKNCICMLSPDLPGNPFYAMGGIPRWPREGSTKATSNNPASSKTLSAYWPGEFFYRSRGEFNFPTSFLKIRSDIKDPNMRYIWDFKYKKINAYMIGGFGHFTTEGIDIFRLTDVYGVTLNNLKGYSDDCYYAPQKNYPRTQTTRVHFSSPEIQGGGMWGQMPYYPPQNPESNDWIWGSPDGFRDGVIFASTERSSLVLEWQPGKGTVQIK